MCSVSLLMIIVVPQVGVVKVTCTGISKFWGPGYIFRANEARHFKFGMHIDGNECYHMHVKLLQYGVYSWSLDLLKYLEK